MRKKVSGRFHSSLKCFRVSKCQVADHWHCYRRVYVIVEPFRMFFFFVEFVWVEFNTLVLECYNIRKISDRPYTAKILCVPNVDKHDTIHVIFCRNIRTVFDVVRMYRAS